jgi:hypothetical protein
MNKKMVITLVSKKIANFFSAGHWQKYQKIIITLVPAQILRRHRGLRGRGSRLRRGQAEATDEFQPWLLAPSVDLDEKMKNVRPLCFER